MGRHIHLDAVGGIAGDMFIGALLACWPESAEELAGQIDKAGFGDLVTLHPEDRNDGVLSGTALRVEPTYGGEACAGGRHYAAIRDNIEASELDEAVKEHALGIFHCLAAAEARVHGKAVEDVHFHEVGAWDSIADIVAAAYLIEASGASSWSVSSLPAGRGRIDTAHGPLPVPAPAVTVMLEGFAFHDDGVAGERVTPTGAAILRYLNPAVEGPRGALTLETSGFGFGSNDFTGISNVLRAVVYASQDEAAPWRLESISRLSFEVDDQSPEDLGMALENLRAMEGVLDVWQTSVYGKKQRGATGVQVLARLEASDRVIAGCFEETTTLGVRIETLSRAALPRMEMAVEKDGHTFHAKVAQRPDGQVTVKAATDELAALGLAHEERNNLREEIESLALESLFGEGEEE